jgi:microcompartment protein CcmL/EutN
VTPALGILELSSIARGVICADAVVKKAPVELFGSRPVSSGKHLVLFRGDVAEVEEAMAEGVRIAGAALLDHLLLPLADPQIGPLLDGQDQHGTATDAVAIVETETVCAAVLGADAAAKAAEVTLVDMRLAVGIGGKAFFTMTGELFAVEAAGAAARAVIDPARLVATEIVPAPHEDLRRRLVV